MKNNQMIKRIVYVGILAALSCVFYIFLKFPLPFIFPSFLDIQFSNLPVILAGFVFGPIEAILIVIVRFLVKLPMSTTASIGELADLIIGLVVASVTSITYKLIHTKKGGILALGMGIIAWVITSIFTNAFLSLPWFKETYGLAPVLSMLKIIPGINEENYILYFVLYSAVPFNLLLSFLVSVLTFIIYKRLSFIIKDVNINKENNYGIVLGSIIIILDLIVLIGYLVFTKKPFDFSKSVFNATATIIGYVLVLCLGLFLIFYNLNKKKED